MQPIRLSSQRVVRVQRREPGSPCTDVFVTTAGGRLFVRAWGDVRSARERAPILLFHDSLGCVELWRDFPPMLARATGRAVIAYDRLGFGQSDPRSDALEFDFVRKEARTSLPALRDALSLERVILFGHSVGGGMAVAAAAAFPAWSEAVITESAQAFVEDRTVRGIQHARRALQTPARFGRLERYHGRKARWVLDAWTETWLSPRFAAWTLDQDLRDLRCPVLALHGDRD